MKASSKGIVTRTTYKVYDDFGEVVKISVDKPSENVYYTKHVEEAFNINNCEAALF